MRFFPPVKMTGHGQNDRAWSRWQCVVEMTKCRLFVILTERSDEWISMSMVNDGHGSGSVVEMTKCRLFVILTERSDEGSQ